MDPAKDNYYPAFDWLRIILALIVAGGHAGLIHVPYSGAMAVDVFFALSGWLIGGILIRSKKEDLPRFYFNRATRIWIPYAVAIFLLLTASVLIEVGIRHDYLTSKWFEMAFYDVTFVYNWFGPPQLENFGQLMPLQGTGNHFWSICAEEQFYLIAPILLVSLASKRSIALWIVISIAAYTFNIYAPIAFGVCAAVISSHIGNWHERYRIHLGVLAAVFLGMVFVFDDYRHFSAPMAICTVLALAIRGRKTQLGSFAGGISYPFYLNHWIGVFAANAAFGLIGLKGTLLAKLCSIFISLFAAAMLFIVIDRPTMKYRSAFFTKQRGIALAATGYSLVAIGTLGGLYLT